MPDISLLPKEYGLKAAPAAKETKLFAVLSFLILFATIGAWGGLYFYNSQISKNVDMVKDEISALPLGDREKEVEKIEEANEKLGAFGGILNNHIYMSNIFSEIEKFTLKKVYFNKFNIDTSKNLLELHGATDSYTTFAKQYNKFNEDSNIVRKADIDKVTTTRGGVDFQVKLYLTNNVFWKNINN